MALRNLLTKRLLNSVKTTVPFTEATVSSPSLQQTLVPQNASKTNFHREYLSSPDSTNRTVFRRFPPRRAVYHSGTARLPEFLSLPIGEKLREKLKGINNISGAGDRFRLSDLNVTPAPAPAELTGNGISVENARKIMRITQMEKVKAKLRNIPDNSVSYSEFLRICVESCENHDQGVEFSKILDESGNVIVLGNVVFLRPEQVISAVLSFFLSATRINYLNILFF